MLRSNVKKFASAISTVIVFPLYLVYLLLSIPGGSDAVFASHSQLISLLPGKTGSFLRNSFYRLTMTRCEQGVVFSFGSLFSQKDTEISSGTYIGPQCNFGSCSVGRDCLIGSGVHILSGKQQHTIDDLDRPIREQGGKLTKVQIGDDCWIGNGAIIMADVGSQCIVAAGSVVVNPVEDRLVVAGNPARVIRERK